MVVKLKLRGIDGRMPLIIESVAKFYSSGENSLGPDAEG